MTAAARPVARLTSPGEIVALVPVLCGFVPQESLVVLSLRGPRKRIGLTMRFDLSWVRADPASAAEEVAQRLELDGAAQVVLVVLSEQPGDLAWSEVVHAVSDACEGRGTAVNEALLVRAGRWWSYVCAVPACCPPEGTPLPSELTPALQLVEAERVLGGRAVLASRDELVESVAPPVLLAAAAAEQHLERAVEQWLDGYHRDGREALRSRGVELWRAVVDRALREPVTAAEAATLAVAVQDAQVRDEVATWSLSRHDTLLAVLLQVARQVVPPEDAAVLALLGWVAYAHGDGGLANVALDRCLSADPDYTLALLLREMLDRQVPPEEVRTLLRSTRRDLRR